MNPRLGRVVGFLWIAYLAGWLAALGIGIDGWRFWAIMGPVAVLSAIEATLREAK